MWQTLGCLVILALSLPVEVPPPGTEHNPPSINQNVSAGGVNTQTGSFSLTRTDIQVRGPGLVFSHSYNSNDTRVGPLGPGWTHSYNIRLTAPGDSSADVVLVGPEGRSDRYTRSASSAFAPPPGVSTLLAAMPNGNLAATTRDQTAYQFDDSGRLTAIVDRFGVGVPLVYNDAGMLVSIGDPDRGATLAPGYDPDSGRLVRIGLADDPVTTDFGYDDRGRLTTLTDRTGAITTYTYDGDSQRLTSITDPRGITVLTNTYDDQGRVVAQTDALGNTTRYTYGTPANASAH